jgi:hypothetical protein
MRFIILENLLFYLQDTDYIKLSYLSKEINNYIKNNIIIYEYYFNNKFSKNFTKKLKCFSNSLYTSYVKIHIFEKNLLKVNNKLWSEEEYFKYWKIYYNI